MTTKFIDMGTRLRDERTRLGLKPTHVATMLDIHPNTLFNYELGKRDTPSSLLPLLRGLGFDIDHILYDTPAQSVDSKNQDDGKKNNGTCLRLVTDSEAVGSGNPMMETMYELEGTLIRSGFRTGIDYTRQSLLTMALGVLNSRGQLNNRSLSDKQEH